MFLNIRATVSGEKFGGYPDPAVGSPPQVADGRLPRNASLHGREKKAEASRELYAACKACRACDRCGAAARKLRRDGAAKLFAQPLSAKAAARDRALGVKKQRAAASPLDDDSDSSDASSEGEPDERELFVTAEEARAQLRLLWKADGAACDGLLGACVCRPGGTDGAEKFFLDVVAVPAPRFRPAQTVGGTLAEHPQNTVLSKALILNRELRKLGSGDDAAADQVKLLDLWLKLQGAINDYVDSSKSTQREAPPGIKQLLEKKEGLFRKHMMGKRVDYCCRSVISPDPFIGGHEIGMPVRFAKALSRVRRAASPRISRRTPRPGTRIVRHVVANAAAGDAAIPWRPADGSPQVSGTGDAAQRRAPKAVGTRGPRRVARRELRRFKAGRAEPRGFKASDVREAARRVGAAASDDAGPARGPPRAGRRLGAREPPAVAPQAVHHGAFRQSAVGGFVEEPPDAPDALRELQRV